jgi:DHA2 family multidrug resistance protein
MATFMEVLDTSIANVSLPHIAGNLSATVDESTWVLTSYLVSNAIILPISGWLSTQIGRKRFYMLCVAMFGLSSFLCGIAPSLGTLVFCRVLQGLGGGGLAPSEQAILADTFEPKKRGIAFAVYGMAVVLAPAIGPTLGGYITDHYSWRWVFFINIPVAVVSLILTHRLVEDPPWLKQRVAGQRVDYIGLGLITIGLGSLQVMLDKGEREDWFSSPFIVTFAVLSGVAIVGAVFWEYFEDHPIVDIRLFVRPTFAISWVMMFMLGLALFGSTVLIPQLLQTLMGYTAQQAGMALSPGGLLVLALMPIVGFLVQKWDSRYLIAIGFSILALSLWHMTSINLEMNFRYAMELRLFQSAGLAFLFVPINTMSYVGVPREKNNEISGMMNLARNMGGSVGISLVQTLLSRRAQVHQMSLSAHTSGYDAAFRGAASQIAKNLTNAGVPMAQATQMAYGRIYGNVLRQAQVLAYIDTVWLFAIAVACMVPLAFLMKKSAGGGMRGAH